VSKKSVKALGTGACDAVVVLGQQQASDVTTGEERAEIAAGMVAGAIHFWLGAHHPCDRDYCDVCVESNTPQKRLAQLLEMVTCLARASPNYRAENDVKEAMQ
jgi:hypothetical protein